MGILYHIAASVIYLGAVLVDMVTLMVLIRVIYRWRPVKVLAGLNTAVEPVVDGLTSSVDRVWQRLRSSEQLSARGKLAISLLALAAVRFALNIFWRVMM